MFSGPRKNKKNNCQKQYYNKKGYNFQCNEKRRIIGENKKRIEDKDFKYTHSLTHKKYIEEIHIQVCNEVFGKMHQLQQIELDQSKIVITLPVKYPMIQNLDDIGNSELRFDKDGNLLLNFQFEIIF